MFVLFLSFHKDVLIWLHFLYSVNPATKILRNNVTKTTIRGYFWVFYKKMKNSVTK